MYMNLKVKCIMDGSKWEEYKHIIIISFIFCPLFDDKGMYKTIIKSC